MCFQVSKINWSVVTQWKCKDAHKCVHAIWKLHQEFDKWSE